MGDNAQTVVVIKLINFDAFKAAITMNTLNMVKMIAIPRPEPILRLTAFSPGLCCSLDAQCLLFGYWLNHLANYQSDDHQNTCHYQYCFVNVLHRHTGCTHGDQFTL